MRQLDPVVGISAISIGRTRMTNQSEICNTRLDPLPLSHCALFKTHRQMVHADSGITKSKSSAERRHLGKCYVFKVSKV